MPLSSSHLIYGRKITKIIYLQKDVQDTANIHRGKSVKLFSIELKAKTDMYELTILSIMLNLTKTHVLRYKNEKHQCERIKEFASGYVINIKWRLNSLKSKKDSNKVNSHSAVTNHAQF